jgi:ABC-type Fe3+-hydroxamate transport system substrate-binding protein
MNEYTDQMNTTIRLDSVPRRIVSLVPSQTQLLHYLGLENEVVGITKFCISPDDWYKSKPRIGGTKSIDIEKTLSLKPDLIIGNKEENSQADIEALRQSGIPLWMSDIFNLEDALQMIRSIGELTNTTSRALSLITDIETAFLNLKGEIERNPITNNKTLYFIWHEPNMVAGQNTFINDMLQKCGLINATNLDRYPEANIDQSPDLILLSSEPYPFKEEHVKRYKFVYPDTKIMLVDGEMFSWYGSKLKDAPAYFKELLFERLV